MFVFRFSPSLFVCFLTIALLVPQGAGAECVDPDGDGYGWNGDRACRTRRVRKNPPRGGLSISNIQTKNITRQSAGISATFSEAASGGVVFGETESFGKTGPYVGFSSTKSFSQTLTDLKPNTLYYFRVYARKGSSKVWSETNQFRTPTVVVTTTVPPTTSTTTTSSTTTSTSTTTTSTSTTSTSTTTTTKVSGFLPEQEQLILPRDAQPSTPALPNVGEFVDMPGTNGLIEMTRIHGYATDGQYTHHYAKRSPVDPFNKYLIFNDYLFHLDSLTEFKRVPFGYEFVVAQTKEDVFFGLRGNKLQSWNAVTDETVDIWTAPSGSDYTIGRWEGQQSWDDKYIPIMWENGGRQIAIVNLETGALVGQMPDSAVNGTVDWVDVSPLGTYAIVGSSSAVYRFDIDLTNMVVLDTNGTGASHGDLMFDKAGNEVFVQEGHFYNGNISYNVLSTNTLHQMIPVNVGSQSGGKYPNTASHISGQMRDVPGTVFISMQLNSTMSNMFTVDLVPGQSKVRSYGHTYTSGNSYPSEAKASISNDGRTSVWSSDWMTGGGVFEMMGRVK